MKILVFSPYYPPHTGGLETHSEEFNQYLEKRGVSFVVLTARIPRDAPEIELRGNIKIIRFPAYEIIRNYPVPKYIPFFPSLKFFRIYRSLWKEHPDIVISRTRFFNSSLWAMFYAKARKIPFVHIEHGSDFVQLSSSFKTYIARIYDYVFGRILFRNSTLNISISKAVRSFVGKFDTRESPVIYRGLDFETIDTIMQDASIREKYARKIIIVTAARLYKWKGIEKTIEAIRVLPDKIKEKIIFLIIGDGEDADRLRKISRNLPVEMLGNLPREQVIAILKVSDIYVHSSLPGGGLSTSLLEAMYCRCAIAATRNEGADEIIENNINGVFIEVSLEKSLQKAIIELSSNREKRGFLGENAQKTVREKFSWDRSIDAYLDIFKTL
jgi:glycosyltransferase involved in cell wall biosynthesis